MAKKHVCRRPEFHPTYQNVLKTTTSVLLKEIPTAVRVISLCEYKNNYSLEGVLNKTKNTQEFMGQTTFVVCHKCRKVHHGGYKSNDNRPYPRECPSCNIRFTNANYLRTVHIGPRIESRNLGNSDPYDSINPHLDYNPP